jgi:hypothetical protein
VNCLATSDTVVTGSTTPILVQAQVSRGNSPVAGATVTFAASRGLVQPTAVTSDATGMTVVQYSAPGTAGAVRIDVMATDRGSGDTASSSCTVQVVTPRDPRVNVQMVVPDQAAGLEIRILYDPARVRLPAGNARAAGSFTSGSCLPVTNDNGSGLVELDIACSSLQSAANGVATFDFDNLGDDELDATDFTASCQAFDEQGRSLGTACTLSVTQI